MNNSEEVKWYGNHGNGLSPQPYYDDPDSTVQFIDHGTGDEESEEFLKSMSRKPDNRLTGREKVLIVLVSVLIIVIITLASAGTFGYYYADLKQPCLETSCVETSASLLSMMDLSVDPCTDFYEYSCGRYLKEVVPPAGKSKWSSFTRVYEKNQEVLKKVLEEAGNVYRGINNTAIGKAKRYYAACMNTTGLEDLGPTPMLRMIADLGSWTLTNDSISGVWKKGDFNLEDLLAKSHQYSVAPFFNLYVAPDDKDSDSNVIQITQSGLGLEPREYYFDNDTEIQREAYIILTASVAALLGADEDQAMQRAKEIFTFESKLAEIFTDEKLLNPEAAYNKMTVKELGDLMPAINFRSYLNTVFGAGNVKDSEDVIVITPNYFVSMSELITNTNKSLLTDYIVWNTIGGMIGYLSNDFMQALKQYEESTQGVSDLPPRWKTCVSRADGVLGFATGALYVEKEFPPESKDSVENIVNAVRTAFSENLPTVEWMDELTRDRALTKLEAINNKIGYPKWLENSHKLETCYEKLQVTLDAAFDNMIIAKKYYAQKNFDKLHKPVDKAEWDMVPAEVNAYYNPAFNEIAFPAGILQSPYYSPKHPMSFNFGAIGMVVGHELTHGFDSNGRHYDEKGNMVNWWQNSSAIEFESHVKCMIDQYSQYPIGDIHLDGESTKNENIADNGGIKVAYMAYKKFAASHPVEHPLPGVNLTSDQLFFVGNAQVWCAYITPEAAAESVLTDDHSNSIYRVIGVDSNFEPFSAAFNCPVGSPMNPEKKCSVW
ncbi:endothelin-converting enzyme 1-like [Glandiceps talaboti]